MLIFVGVHAQERLSFDEALSRMVLNNRAINGAKYGVDAAYSEYRATHGLRAPQVELMGGYTLMQHDIDIDLGGAKGVVTESLESLINKGITGGIISPTIAALLSEGLAPIHSADWSYTLQKRDFGFVGTTISVPIYLGGRINIANRVAKLKVESANNLLEGVNLINDLEDFDVKVPVVINSTTQIPNFESKKAEWERRGLEIYKTEYMINMKNWFVEFLKEE